MKPNYSPLPFDPGATCYAIDGALEGADADALVREATEAGFAPAGVDYPPSYRDNDRRVRDDPDLARRLFARLGPLLPERLVDPNGDAWTCAGLNDRFRFCRYRGDQCFRVHRDGAHAPSPGLRSRLTLQLYLDDGFTRGTTRFYPSRTGAPLGAVVPVRGRAIVFDHRLWHDGERVGSGVKHVLRADVMYRRPEPPAARSPAGSSIVGAHGGYVFAVLVLADGSIVSGSRDRTLRHFTHSAEGWSCARIAQDHAASVLTLVETSPGVVWSGSRDRTIRETDLRTGRSRVVATAGGAVLSLCRTATGAVAAGSADGTVLLLDTLHAAGGARSLVGHTGWVWSVAAVGSGCRLASGSEDGTVRLWDLASGETLACAAPGRGPVHALAPLGERRLAAGFADGHVVVYELAGGDLLPIDVIRAHAGEVYALAARGSVLATAGEDDQAYVVSLETSARSGALPHGDFVRAVAWRGSTLVTGSYDGVVRAWPSAAAAVRIGEYGLARR